MDGTVHTEYASLSGKIHTLVIDKSLTISGAAADAKVTGDKLEKALNSVKEAKEFYKEAIAGVDQEAAIAAEKAVNALTAADLNAYDKPESLSDDTRLLLGLEDGATPDDALRVLASVFGAYSYQFTATFSDGTVASGVRIGGVSSIDGGTVITDSNGQAIGVSIDASITVGVADHIGIVDYTGTFTAESEDAVNPVTITLTKDTSAKKIETSKTVYLSDKVKTLDICCVGGGGGGGGGSTIGSDGDGSPGGGGGGGYVTNALDVELSSYVLSVDVGAGGEGGVGIGNTYGTGKAGGTGGKTTVKYNGGETILSASGGIGGQGGYNRFPAAGGAGNGAGGQSYCSSPKSYSTPGTAASVNIFGETSLGLAGGGGGGGGGSSGNNPYTNIGGEPHGGTGNSSQGVGFDATGTGGGGGGGGWSGSEYTTTRGTGGAGYKGAVYLRAGY